MRLNSSDMAVPVYSTLHNKQCNDPLTRPLVARVGYLSGQLTSHPATVVAQYNKLRMIAASATVTDLPLESLCIIRLLGLPFICVVYVLFVFVNCVMSMFHLMNKTRMVLFLHI